MCPQPRKHPGDLDAFPVLSPDLQVDFWHRLEELRQEHFAPALAEAVAEMHIPALDDELADYVPVEALKRISSFGLRADVFFPVPMLLRARPALLGYYRLLYGLSQKEFYNKGPFGLFRTMEAGKLSTRAEARLTPLCQSLAATGARLVEALGLLSKDIVHELQLLTLGPQLRGGRNTKRGQAATLRVFELLGDLTKRNVVHSTPRVIQLVNDSRRSISIAFGSDPDIAITEEGRSATLPLVSVEIKGGTDRSNIHNRLGEAEKSHRKAKSRGFFEFWTIVGVEVDLPTAQRESPTTTHFFYLEHILDPQTSAHEHFRDVLASKVGIGVTEE